VRDSRGGSRRSKSARGDAHWQPCPQPAVWRSRRRAQAATRPAGETGYSCAMPKMEQNDSPMIAQMHDHDMATPPFRRRYPLADRPRFGAAAGGCAGRAATVRAAQADAAGSESCATFADSADPAASKLAIPATGTTTATAQGIPAKPDTRATAAERVERGQAALCGQSIGGPAV